VITALDSSVLLDIFGADAKFGPLSRDAVRSCREQGGLVACDVVWAEVGAAFPAPEQARAAMDQLGVQFVPLDSAAALVSGEAWRSYRRNGGPRHRVMSDFLIGAHASAYADRLLTRDRGFFRRYFGALDVLDPSV
jgi:predicted nucleic acid-binding protein